MSKKYIYTVLLLVALLALFAVALTVAVGKSGTPEEAPDESAIKLADDPYCLLVTGRDRVSALTDVIMLACFDPAAERICVLQIPRDTYALYGDGRYRKINGAQKELGEDGLRVLLENALGIEIDGYISLDLDAFGKSVDALGGVEIELDAPLRYSDPSQNLHIDLDSGRQTLDGKQAEMLVRYRSGYLRGDLDRLDVQKKFLAALFDTLRAKVSVANAYELASALLGEVSTDVNLALCTALALEALKLDKSRLLFCTLPGEDIVSRKSGASFYVMAKSPTQRLLAEYFCAEGELDEEKIFLNSSDRDFLEIYQKDLGIGVICADELEKTKKD
jgi:LCP family protein required for cell wall assembly